MDSGRVLVALQEREKWRERRARLEGRLRSVQARRRFLQREVEAVQQRLERLERLLVDVPGGRGPQGHVPSRMDR